MSGKIYIGLNNVSIIPRSIYVGANNIAHKVSAAYIGDENNRAKKIWPVSVLPNGYQQVEWIHFLTGKMRFNTYVNVLTQPRIVFLFKTNSSIQSDSGCLFGAEEFFLDNYNKHFNFQVITRDYGPNNAAFIIDNYSYIYDGRTETWSGIHDFHTNQQEGMLQNATYLLDFNNMENNVSRYYLYCDKGYYSLERNNLLVSHSKMNLSPYSVNTHYIYLFFNDEGSNPYTTPLIYFYNCEMYDNSGNTSGDIIHEYYPCYRKADNKAGLYDLVDRIFLEPYVTVTEGTDYELGPEI